MAKYNNLEDLIGNSNSSRSFFSSLPTDIQAQLHSRNSDIHTAHELRQTAVLLQNHAEFMESNLSLSAQNDGWV